SRYAAPRYQGLCIASHAARTAVVVSTGAYLPLAKRNTIGAAGTLTMRPARLRYVPLNASLMSKAFGLDASSYVIVLSYLKHFSCCPQSSALVEMLRIPANSRARGS